jgi:hypothetical protein
MKEDEMDGACSMHGRGDECIQNHVWLEYLKGRDHLEGIGIGAKVVLEWILGK